MKINCNNYIHNRKDPLISYMREIIFGMEDGMVSTLGAITGIAIGSENRFMVLLSGLVIVSVESISMGIGTYLANLSEKRIEERKVHEEKVEIHKSIMSEKKELVQILQKDGWPEEFSEKMAEEASKDKKLMLREMKYRELGISGKREDYPAGRGKYMFGAYIVGGTIPLFTYFIFPLPMAIYISVPITFFSLFLLGVATTRYTMQSALKAGSHMLFLGGTAVLIGYLVGLLVKMFFPQINY